MSIMWREEYSVGNPVLDGQHQRLFDILNGLFNEISSRPDEQLIIIPEVVERLLDYLQYHFHSEEEHMRKVHFEELKEHAKSHQLILSRLVEIKNSLITNETALTPDLVVFFEKWLVKHILEDDMKYKGLA